MDHFLKTLVKPPSAADESNLEFPMDNVYFTTDFCYRRYTLEEAVKDLRAHYEVDIYLDKRRF